ncbi:hypothetical protein FRC08_017852 [Ceratobasidium sp. 394]|nr:hypothetical protein FRC08_017852 [Ceratobasidium sp. 394]
MTIPTISASESSGIGDAFKALQDVICNAPSVTVLCGAGVSTGAGIRDFRSADGLYRQTFTSGSTTIRGRDLFNLDMLNSLNTLGVLNRVMLDLRIQAQQASPTAFHQLVHAFFSLQCLVQCYTQNFDGLQTKDHPEMEPMVYEIHGSNMQLKCRVCHSTVPGHTEAFDRSLANENPVECPHCLQHGQ